MPYVNIQDLDLTENELNTIFTGDYDECTEWVQNTAKTHIEIRHGLYALLAAVRLRERLREICDGWDVKVGFFSRTHPQKWPYVSNVWIMNPGMLPGLCAGYSPDRRCISYAAGFFVTEADLPDTPLRRRTQTVLRKIGVNNEISLEDALSFAPGPYDEIIRKLRIVEWPVAWK